MMTNFISTMNTTIMTNITLAPAQWLRIALIFLFILILIIGLMGNSLVLLSIMSKNTKLRRSPTNLLLVNMSCADLIILIFNTFDIIQFSIDHSWPTAWSLGLVLCKIIRFAQVLGCYVSVQTLLVISVERYIAIIHPIKVTYGNRRIRLFSIFIIIWSIGIIMASPNLYFLTLHQLVIDRQRTNHRELIDICALSNHPTHTHLIRLYKYMESILFFFIPILVQMVLYIIICRNIFLVNRAVQARHQAQELLQSSVTDSLRQYSGTKSTSLLPSPGTDNNLSASPIILPRSHAHPMTTMTTNKTGKGSNVARKRAIIMLLLVAILYFVAFSPSPMNFIYAEMTGYHYLYDNRLLFIISILLALSSTAINPILFYIFSKFFRENFNKIIRNICPSVVLGSKRQNSFPMC